MNAYPFWETVAADLTASKLLKQGVRWNHFTLVRKVLWAHFFHPRFMCVFWYRVNRFIYLHKIPGRELLSAWRMLRFGNDISYYADIGPGLFLVHLAGIVVGGKVVVGKNAMILNDVTIGAKGSDDLSMPRIGDHVYIGSGAKIIGGITIGNDVVIGTLTFCNKGISNDHLVYGISPNQTIKPK
jgi:serine O-acetyltransferase